MVLFAGKKCTKQTLNILISIPTTDGQEKSPFQSEAIFFTNINRHSYLVTMHASNSKTQHQSPIQYKADVSSEERENKKDLNK